VVINGDQREKVGEKEIEVRTHICTHGETENGSRSDNSKRRTLAWPAKRLYAVCVLYGNTARVPTPIFIHCRYNALLLPSGTIHLSPGLRELLSYRRDDAARGRLLSSDSDI